jgi:hypothetical protein
MKVPPWFWVGIAIWAVLGLPGLVLGLLYKGSPIPDPPPFLQHPYEDYSFAANASWLVVMALCFLPLFLTAVLLMQRRGQRKNSNAKS